jgi:general secretion pathway protein A
MDSQSLATVILVGHPDLRRTLHLTVHEAFSQRLTVRYHLGPLDLAETLGYVRHHVRAAGYTADPLLFTDDALQRIFDFTKGLPRRINQVCTTALTRTCSAVGAGVAGLIDQKQILDEATIRKAIAELDHD